MPGPTTKKDTQTANCLGGIYSGDYVTLLLSQGKTPAQIAVIFGTTLADVTRILALPTPT